MEHSITVIRPWHLFLALWLAFLFGPIRTSPRGDVPADLLGESLLSGRGFDLSPFYAAQLPPGTVEVRRDGERVLANVGVTHAVFSLPFAAGLRALYPGLEPVARARMTGRVAGAFFTAAAVAVTFAVLLRLLAPGPALLLCLGAAFASPLYSTASRSATPHGPAALAIAGLLWLASEDAGWRRVARGAVCACLYFLRPPSLLAPAVLLMALERAAPRSATRTGVRPLALGALLAAVPLALFHDASRGHPAWSIPAFDTLAGSWGFPSVRAVAAYLVSPARSVLLFAPIALLSLAGWARSRGAPYGWMARAGATTTGIALVEISCREQWWGGFGFGPHLLADYAPLLAVMAAFAPSRLVAASPLVLLPLAILHGAFVFRGGHLWDERRQIDAHPEVVWDLRDSPVTDVLRGPPPPDPAGLSSRDLSMELGEHPAGAASGPAAGRTAWYVHGWELPEDGGTWAAGSESWLALSLPGPGDYELTLDASAPWRRGRPQSLTVEVPGTAPQVYEFTRGLWDFEQIRLHVPYRPGTVIVRLRPRHVVLLGQGDVRRCTVFVKSLRLDRKTLAPVPGRQ